MSHNGPCLDRIFITITDRVIEILKDLIDILESNQHAADSLCTKRLCTVGTQANSQFVLKILFS